MPVEARETVTIDGEEVDAELAPLLLDVSNETDITISDMKIGMSPSWPDGRGKPSVLIEAVDFFFADSDEMSAFLTLCLHAQPALRPILDNFWSNNACELGWLLAFNSEIVEADCGHELVFGYTVVTMPLDIALSLVADVNKFLLPSGFEGFDELDIVDEQ